MNQLFNALASWSVDHRWPTLLLMALLTTGSVVGFVAPELAELADYDEQLETGEDGDEELKNDKTPAKPLEKPRVRRRPRGGGMFNADAILVVDSKNFFSEEGTRALRQVVSDLETLDYVSRVTWPDSVPLLNIFGLAEPLFPRPESSDRRFAAAKERALQNPLVKGQLLSEDAETMLMLVSFDYAFVFSDEQVTTGLKEVAQAAAAKFPEAGLTFQVTGSEPAIIAAISQHESNQMTFLTIGFGMVAVMAIILFRGINTVIIVSVAPVVGVAWTLGMIRFVEYNEGNGLINVILPVLVALVGITDGVHLMVQTRKLRASGLSVREAARKGLQQVGLACFLTSFTTAVGFGSLILADSSFVRDFGKCAVIGVTMSFLSVVTIIPLLCSTRLGRNIHVGLEESPIDRNLGRIGGLINVVLRYRRSLSVAGIAATAVLFAVCMTLEPDSRQRDNLPADAEATLAMEHVDEAMGGMETGRIDVFWPTNMSIDDPQILHAVMAVDDLLGTEELIGHPLSIRNLIDAQPGVGPPEERMSMLELLPPPIKDLFISPDDGKAIVTFKVKDLGIAAYGPVFERFEAGIEGLKSEFPGFDFELNGGAVWRWRNLYVVVVDLASSLGTASIIIFGVMAFAFRSLRIGLISIVPNTLPLVVAGAWLVFAGYNLEVVMVCCFTVCLGIAVDDSIHFLTRFHEELESAPDVDDAIRRAFTGVGTALIMTTLVLVAGFTTVMFSNNREYFIFAVMGAITIASALFADLVFLPPLLARFAPRSVAAGTFTATDVVEHSGTESAADPLAESQPL